MRFAVLISCRLDIWISARMRATGGFGWLGLVICHLVICYHREVALNCVFLNCVFVFAELYLLA